MVRALSARSVGVLVVVGAAAALLARATRDPGTTSSSLPLPVGCRLGPTTSGIDVSYHQGDIAWARVRRAGIRFAYVRAFDGVEVDDPSFVTNWRGAHAAGVLRGAYQFFRPEASPTAQADALIATLRAHGAGELPPALDVETAGGLSSRELATRASAWLARVRAELGVEPVVYTSPALWRDGAAAPLATQPLWLAHYTTRCPEVPPPFARWAFWQYTEAGRVPGISTPVDLDVFDGSVEDLGRRFRR